MLRREEITSSMAVVAVAIGTDFVSGRALAAFYAQMARASWLGVVISSLMFGLLTGQLAVLARRIGAGSVSVLFRRLPGGGTGGFVAFLYRLMLVGAGCMLVGSAAHIGALALPVPHASVLAALFTVALSLALALSGKNGLRMAGGCFVVLLFIFELALLCFAELPAAPRMRYEIRLHLRDSWVAALIFALLHTAVSLCISAGTTIRMCSGRVRPGRLGACAGGMFGLLLLVGNAILVSREEELLALKLPFVALSGGWGTTGFYLNTGLTAAAAVIAVAGILVGLRSGEKPTN